MKKYLLFFASLFIFQLSVTAQNQIILDIHHKLGDADFSLNAPMKNNIGHDFMIDRMEYYMSGISILHDGGTETLIEDFWLLIDANKGEQALLGTFNIDEVGGIKFHIGVDSAHNHLDPAQYPAQHPLAPQFPSMHWGWIAGYRFIALEGYGGSNYDQALELHGLWDHNYFENEIPVSASADNGVITINLDADYVRALEDIEVNSGAIDHSSDFEALEALENFRDYVFTASATTTTTEDIANIQTFEVFPNPASGGISTLRFEAYTAREYEVWITDLLGQPVQHFELPNGETATELTFDQSGLYFVSLMQAGQVVMTKKLVVQR